MDGTKASLVSDSEEWRHCKGKRESKRENNGADFCIESGTKTYRKEVQVARPPATDGEQSEVLLEERETAAAPREHGATTCLTSSFDDAASGVGCWAEEAAEQIIVRDRRFWGQCDMKRKTPVGRGWSS